MIAASAPSLLPLISSLRMIAELWLVIVMTAIVYASPIWCMVWYWLGWVYAMTPKACRQTGTDAEVVGCLWLLSVTFWVLQSLPDVCQGGPGTMLPIWKQLLLGLVDLMDGKIFLGCPAEPADRNPINHSPPAPTDGHPPQLRPTGQGFCQGISSSLHLSLDHRQTYLIMLSVSLC